ncbi:PTS fructose transporter subunit IIA [Pelomonas sp. SE-A7]|uniref:PTS sugar transporter subunit IIA n=1 Tax=Pelomonas sp. SE-A7 TaxID=3054953 RepID=UPI00259CE377|nr:PTS fructose transporter subunit IIA [Pelomonas sp. SE-A7]MDM4767970.1 PTS fructose transporter subunit IIA [Pelomonas sp. SE-A7]
MAHLLLIAHAPLASALKAVAQHTFPSCTAQLSVLDVAPEMSADEVESQARALLASAGADEVLVLTDVFGATPSNAAQRLLGEQVRMVSGVNVPMLWRTLCYSSEPLDALAQRAIEGGGRGIAPVTSPDKS